MNVRLARPDDVQALLEVELTCFDEPNTEFLAHACGFADCLYVAEGDEVRGYVFAAPDTTDRARILSLAVLPRHRRRGVATTLMHRVLGELGARGFDTVALEARVSNHAALSLYRRMGFTLVGEKNGYYEDGEDAYVLEKRL